MTVPERPAGPRGGVALTGATGFLGRRLSDILTARGHGLSILARRPVAAAFGAAAPRVVAGDLADTAALAALTEGAGTLIHCAGLIKAARRSDFFEVNEAGCERAARAAANAGARMILVSSLTAREPGLSDYAASKAAGEAAARRVLGANLTILRPPAIYGPGDRETLGLFQLAAASPLAPFPDAPAARLALTHVDEVAATVCAALEQGWSGGVHAPGGARPSGYGWREIFTAAAVAVGRTRPVLVPLPLWLISGAAAVSETLAAARGAPAIFNRGKARELAHGDWSVSEAELPPWPTGPAMSLADGFSDTVAWYRAAGWLS